MVSFFTTVVAAPVGEIAAAPLNDLLVPSNDFSFIRLFMEAEFIVEAAMVLLILSSVWSWAIIFDKLISFKTINTRMKRFENELWSGASLDKVFRQIKNKQDHPLALVFAAAIDEWNVANNKNLHSDTATKVSLKERIAQAMRLASYKSLDSIEKNINFLATVGSSAPFIGLFGTVWGIMVSFQAIAISKNTSLAVVAPGIAEALLATALGLIAAIPSVIFYNKFASEINKIANKIDMFSLELTAMISREIDSQ